MKVIHVLRKPCSEPTVASNVLRHAVGAINVDGCRVGTSDSLGGGATGRTGSDQKGNEGYAHPWMADPVAQAAHAQRIRLNVTKAESLGRWPANVIHDGSDEVAGCFPQSSGKGGDSSGGTALGQGSGWNAHNNHTVQIDRQNDTGSAARFFQVVRVSGAGQ